MVIGSGSLVSIKHRLSSKHAKRPLSANSLTDRRLQVILDTHRMFFIVLFQPSSISMLRHSLPCTGYECPLAVRTEIVSVP
uniref:Uncharacterized protein n=1 Tax=Physcomitrium patens TaxID=3218 RepID=A0A2K1JU55_PHYPA|nr:hypothetical protein PHYPA_014807 [Physcomitrium patens]